MVKINAADKNSEILYSNNLKPMLSAYSDGHAISHLPLTPMSSPDDHSPEKPPPTKTPLFKMLRTIVTVMQKKNTISAIISQHMEILQVKSFLILIINQTLWKWMVTIVTT